MMKPRFLTMKPYFLSFIEEYGSNPAYKDYIFGRVEVYDKIGGATSEEIMFCTKKRRLFSRFREKWDFYPVTKEQLDKVRDAIGKRFSEHPRKDG